MAIESSNPSCEVRRPPHKSHPKGLCSGSSSFSTTPMPLYKQKSWSPDDLRDEAWLRRKGHWKNRRSKSVTDEDVDELKACIELGFGFDSSPELEPDQRLSDALPALGLYYAVNKSYDYLFSKSSAPTTPSDCHSTPSPVASPPSTTPIFSHGDNPQTVKTRLKQWAQVVACAVRQSPRA
ncbi:uncharacterized protein LOC114722268 [Neltuma alba]|uniref:uncharacterized protein LOC114722268 n=1 Tax=Neltuma alba TaxID=207710 RepID=UPI0010A56551|nr:uncharacterized protein LOC114722268 [Prosopis alba]